MQVLLIRHARAEDREEFAFTGRDDSERPLTTDGAARMRKIAGVLSQLTPELRTIYSSPYLRAMQTAHILADAYGVAATPLDGLRLDAHPPDLFPLLRRHKADPVIAMVGHEPHLGLLAGWMLSGQPKPLLIFKKGGAALLECAGTPGAGAFQLHWSMQPRHLRHSD